MEILLEKVLPPVDNKLGKECVINVFGFEWHLLVGLSRLRRSYYENGSVSLSLRTQLHVDMHNLFPHIHSPYAVDKTIPAAGFIMADHEGLPVFEFCVRHRWM